MAALLLLAGCADDPEPKFAEPTEAASASPSESATQAAAETPEEFIRRWAELSTDMQNTGDTEAYLAITKGCRPCQDTADNISGIYAAGGSVEWGGMTVERIKTLSGGAFDVWTTSKPTRYRRSASASEKRLPGGRVKYQLVLADSGDGYVLVDLAQRPL
ncbi:hypothetical protein [Nocardioides solisilvae]|uniref:hypothetical protein n=1 Tax=Nocardioides solisilvae TaxID=1542435 RepID=UPI000D7495F7|nr:hypothetical protein [Nocardioides solisilvae]